MVQILPLDPSLPAGDWHNSSVNEVVSRSLYDRNSCAGLQDLREILVAECPVHKYIFRQKIGMPCLVLVLGERHAVVHRGHNHPDNRSKLSTGGRAHRCFLFDRLLGHDGDNYFAHWTRTKVSIHPHIHRNTSMHTPHRPPLQRITLITRVRRSRQIRQKQHKTNKRIPSIQDPFAHYDSLYDKPWTRIGPYLVGMITGWYLFKINCKAKMKKAAVAFGWTLSLITMMSIVYGLHGTTFGPALSVLYTALSHSTWAICLAWILIACVTDHGGVVNYILSWKYMYPISRLTYCVYLIHPMVIRAVILQNERSWYLSRSVLMTLYFGNVVLSYAVSLFLSLLFEAPVISLLRILHPMRMWRIWKL